MAVTSSDPVALLGRCLDHTGEVVHRVTAEQLTRATPCTEWDVRALLTHLINVVDRCTSAVTNSEVPSVDAIDLAQLVAAYDAAATRAKEAWRTPGVLDRDLNTSWGVSAARTVCRLNLADTLVHSWDLARAIGVATDGWDDELADAALAFMHEMMKPEFRGGPGFGPEVTVAADATVYERLAAFAGRTPRV
jgi:uncharacterized protein (TIGR03086 family)